MPALHRIAEGGVSVLIDTTGDDPVVVHWGADVGGLDLDPALLLPAVPHSMFDDPVRPSVLPQLARGWRGRPAVRGSRAGRDFSPRFALVSADGDGASIALRLTDADAGLDAETSLTLTPSGLLLIEQAVTNRGEGDYVLERLDAVLPVPARAVESLDTTGRWAREKHPQRRGIQQGTWVRSGRHGRTGHDAPVVTAAGTAGFGWRTGEVWALHLGWSGDHESFVERLGSGDTVLGAGELLQPGEVVLAPGETYRAPTVYAAWSAAGLDGVSARFHEWMRARPTHPATPRPVVLNTWEAVYFAHDLDTLKELADTAASLGVERFVLDDGWFTGRRHDRAGLGDWLVDETVWPSGLTPLIEHVKRRGMQFGLWVEPEMINEDSDLAREHPDWISRPGARTSIDWRHQQVVDLANPAAWQHILDALDAILTENAIDYLKWDQNRDQLELGHDGAASAHEQTLAAYRLFDELRRRASRRRDRELLLGRRPGGPRDPGAHGPDLDLGHERRPRAADHPALDRAARAARARRRPCRADALAQHRPGARHRLPGDHRDVRPLRHRVGRAAGRRGRPRPARRGHPRVQGAAGADRHRADGALGLPGPVAPGDRRRRPGRFEGPLLRGHARDERERGTGAGALRGAGPRPCLPRRARPAARPARRQRAARRGLARRRAGAPRPRAHRARAADAPAEPGAGAPRHPHRMTTGGTVPDNTLIVGDGALPPRARFATDAPVLSLNGSWRFQLSPTVADAPDGVGDLAFDDAGWGSIDVPSSWPMAGHGAPAYTNTVFPFPVDPPHPPDENPVGDFRRRFTWDGGPAILRLDGVDNAGEVWLNGRRLGSTRGSRLVHEFDATDALVAGENLLVLRVTQWSATSYLEDQDMWWLPGVFRDVTLQAAPAGGIADVVVHADWSDGAGVLRVDVDTRGGAAATVAVPALGLDGLEPGREHRIDGARPWTAETPDLVEVVVATGAETATIRVGFRTITIEDAQLKVNGQRIRFRGVNRHEHHPDLGRVIPPEVVRAELLLMKQHNVNAIRTSHYPPHPDLPGLADELGFYLIDECDLETHGFIHVGWRGNPSDDPSWEPAYVDRMTRTVARDRNHPSVILWSLGNEAGTGRNLETSARVAHELDPSRPVHYEGDWSSTYVDVYSRMYAHPDEVDAIGRQAEEPLADAAADAHRRALPFLQCEYIHAMGNGPGGIDEYEASFRRYPRTQGGFVWEWLEHGIRRTTPDGRTWFAYGGDFGEPLHDGNFVADGLVDADRTPRPGLEDLKKAYEPVYLTVAEGRESVEVENAFDFRGLDGLALEWRVEGADAGGSLPLPEVAPHATAVVPLPDAARGEGVLTVRLVLADATDWATAGHELAWAQAGALPVAGSARAIRRAGHRGPRAHARPRDLRRRHGPPRHARRGAPAGARARALARAHGQRHRSRERAEGPAVRCRGLGEGGPAPAPPPARRARPRRTRGSRWSRGSARPRPTRTCSSRSGGPPTARRSGST